MHLSAILPVILTQFPVRRGQFNSDLTSELKKEPIKKFRILPKPTRQTSTILTF